MFYLGYNSSLCPHTLRKMGTNVIVHQGKNNAKGKEALHILYWKRGRGDNEGSGVGMKEVGLAASFSCDTSSWLFLSRYVK